MSLQRSDWARTGRAGPSLSYVVRRVESPKAVIGIVPGYADHAERYERAMDVWADLGIASVGIDLRGHGRSGGTRGHILAFEEYIDDFRELGEMMGRVARDAGKADLPRLVFGHSFGCVVTLKSLLAGVGGYRAVALSDPYLGLALAVPKAKLAAGHVMSRIIPSLGLPSGLRGDQMTNDPEEAKRYDADPLFFKVARARWFTETLNAQSEILQRAREITLPLCITFGEADPVAKIETGKAFFDAAGSTDKKWISLPGMKHEPFFDKEGKPLAKQVGEWLLARAV